MVGENEENPAQLNSAVQEKHIPTSNTNPRVFYSGTSVQTLMRNLQPMLREEISALAAPINRLEETIHMLIVEMRLLEAIDRSSSPPSRDPLRAMPFRRETTTPQPSARNLRPSPQLHLGVFGDRSYSEPPRAPLRAPPQAPLEFPPSQPPSPTLPPATQQVHPQNGAHTPADSSRMPPMQMQLFHGKDTENILAWLHSIGQIFLLYNVSEAKKVALASSALRDDAHTFYYYLVVSNGGIDISWPQFEHEFRTKYDKTRARSNRLRYELSSVVR